MLRVARLSKRYSTVTALDDVSFDVAPGQIVGFLGPNGAGKTTTMRAIMSLITVDEGQVTWKGSPIDDDVRSRFGYMPAERGMYQNMPVGDHLRYYARLSGLDKAAAGAATDRWLDKLGLTARADDNVQTLSSGNQQRVQLALALLTEPDLLVLDEPFAGLDPVATQTLSELLLEEVERGAGVLLSSHQLDLVADVCSAVVIVDAGRIVLRGEVAELRAASPVRRVEIEFAHPVDWAGTGGDHDVEHGGRLHRQWIDRGADPDVVLAAARSVGDVLSYTVGPPDLSEVFYAAVTPGATPAAARRSSGPASAHPDTGPRTGEGGGS